MKFFASILLVLTFLIGILIGRATATPPPSVSAPLEEFSQTIPACVNKAPANYL